MNLARLAPDMSRSGVPRTRGDEPLTEAAEAIRAQCSPHTRG